MLPTIHKKRTCIRGTVVLSINILKNINSVYSTQAADSCRLGLHASPSGLIDNPNPNPSPQKNSPLLSLSPRLDRKLLNSE